MLKNLIVILFLMSSFSASAQYSATEEKMGKKVYQLMEKTYGFYEDEQLQNWVEGIGQRLEAHIEGDYHFNYYITDQEDLNAFATAGGYVFVTRGLLALVNSDDELAGVLAHEISHVTEKHASKSNRASIIPSILELPANIIGFITYAEFGNILNLPITLTSELALSSYSRSQEREADRLGVKLAYKAGYDPYSLINALEKLESFTETAYQVKSKKSLFNDHPMTEDRAKDLNELLAEMEVEQKEKHSGSNIMAQDGLLFGQNPRKTLIKDNIAVHSGLRFYIQFPKSYSVNRGGTSLSAVSHDGRSSILINIDSLANEPEYTAKLELSQLKNIDLRSQERLRINGLESYKAEMIQSRLKYPDMITKVYWVKNPISGMMIRILTISPAKDPDPHLDEAVASLRLLKMEDINEWTFMRIRLEEEGKLEYLSKENPQYVEALQILNDLEEGEFRVDEGRFYKLIEQIPLSEF